jgi:hypothetical protein
MTLARVLPKVAALPEIATYKCGHCGEVFSKIRDDK